MTDTINDTISQSFATINDSITLFKMQLNSLQQHVRTLEKQVRKETKSATKVLKNKDKPKKPKAPSGFAKPTKVTKELCEFMEKPEGTEISQYIKANNLQEKGENSKNRINPDAKLKSLLGLTNDETENLTYFTIQKYMNKHFIKSQYC